MTEIDQIRKLLARETTGRLGSDMVDDTLEQFHISMLGLLTCLKESAAKKNIVGVISAFASLVFVSKCAIAGLELPWEQIWACVYNEIDNTKDNNIEDTIDPHNFESLEGFIDLGLLDNSPLKDWGIE